MLTNSIISTTRRCDPNERRPNVASQKVYCASSKDYISPGSFILLSRATNVFQILSVLEATNIEEVPETTLERATLNPNAQIMKLLIYKRSQEIPSSCQEVTPLRQRSVRDIIEVVRTNDVTFALNIDIDSICFCFMLTLLYLANMCALV